MASDLRDMNHKSLMTVPCDLVKFHSLTRTISSSVLYPYEGTSSSMVAKTRQSCLTLCNPMDCDPPGSSAHGILRARIRMKKTLFLEILWALLMN